MGAMSGFAKYFVNGFSGYTSKKVFNTIHEHLTIPEDARCLEIGAGRGALSLLLCMHYNPKRLLVTDYDPSQVAEAKEYFKSRLGAIPEGVEIRVADALQLPFEEESFDVVVAINALHHVGGHQRGFENIPKALDEIQRVLEQGGKFVYGELFNKNPMRDRLTQMGFEEIFVERSWRISDFCIYRKVGGNSARKSPKVELASISE